MEPAKSPSPTLNAMLSSLGDMSAIMAGSPTNSTSETTASSGGLLPNGKKTKGRVKIKMEYIGNKLRRYTTFSKRKTGIMKKAYELSTLTGTQVMLLVASETGHVYTYATKKLTPMLASETGKNLIQQCLSQPDGKTTPDPADPQASVAPCRSEFTFDVGGMGGPRKRRANAPTPQMPSSMEAESAIASLLPTMVPAALFQQYTDEDYQQEDSDASDAEELAADDAKSDDLIVAEDEKDKSAELSASLKQTLKDALKAAANNRATIAAAKKRKMTTPTSIPSSQPPPVIPSALLSSYLMAASCLDSAVTVAGENQTNKDNIVYAGPQGVVYAPESNDEDASAAGQTQNNLLNAKATEEAQKLLSSFPFNFNLQQMLETANFNALKTEVTGTD